MSDRFRGAWLKIRRAKKHLSDFHDMFVAFSNSSFRTMGIEEHPEKARTHSLRIDMDMVGFNSLADDATMIIGDVLHNLKSALDHIYFQTVLACRGKPSDRTRFPVTETREGLESWLNTALEKKQIASEIKNLILDGVKSYEAGNPTIYGLHKLNIIDKHERVIPTLKLVGFFNVRIEDDHGKLVGRKEYVADESCLIPLTGTYGKKIELKNQGIPSANILFDLGASGFAGETVFPTLARVAEVVTHTVEAFEVVKFE